MDDIAKNYIENPTLVIALSIGIMSIFGFSVWLIRWILVKLISTLNNNTAAMTNVSTSTAELKQAIVENTTVMGALVTEQKLVNMQLQQTIKKN
jgi:hypothetical protein